MDFRIADTFTDSLSRLTGDEQKLAKTTTFDLQLNPANPGMQFHKLTRSKDANFWSVRVGSDLRLIVHKTASSQSTPSARSVAASTKSTSSATRRWRRSTGT